METIGKRVRAARQELGLTMKQLHEQTGLSTGNISDIENDRNTPSVSSLVALGRALRRSLDWLLTGEEASARSNESPLTCDGVPLSQMETDLLAMFRLLPPAHREEVFELVHFKYKREVEEKKKNLFTRHISTGARTKKAAPLGAVRPATEPPNFFVLP